MTGRPALGWPWGALLVVNLVVLPFALTGHHVGDTDTFYHLAGGRWMLEHGRVLDRETFSFTRPGEPWTNYYWLFEWLVAWIDGWGGFRALNGLRAVLVLATANLVLFGCRRQARGVPLLAPAVALVAMAVYLPRAFSLRPHLFSYLFLSIGLLLLERMWRRPGRLDPWLPLLCVPWASLHGVEYPVVLTVVGAYGIAALSGHWRKHPLAVVREPDLRRWLLLGLLCGVAFLVNPFGVGIFKTAAIGFDREAMSRIGEMRPIALVDALNLYVPMVIPALGHLNYFWLLALAAVPGWLRERDARAVLVVALATGLTVGKVRFGAELAVLGAPLVVRGLAATAEVASRRWRLAGWGLCAAMAAIVILAAAQTTRERWAAGLYRPLGTTSYPVGPVAFLRRYQLTGNVFNDPTMGGFVSWALAPRVRVFMDMRTPEPFDARISWLAQGVARAVPDMPLTVLTRRWPIDFVLVRREWKLTRDLLAAPDHAFALVYADWQFVLFASRERQGTTVREHGLNVIDVLDSELRYVEGLSPSARADLRTELTGLLAVRDDNMLAHETDLALLLAEHRWAEALDHSEALQHRPEATSYAAYVAAVALARLGRDGEAYPRFQELAQAEPAYLRAYPALAETALRLGRPGPARRAMERYLVLREYFLTGTEYGLLGNTRYQSGAWAPAVEAYERALLLTEEDHPDRVTLETNLASALIETGETARAAGLLASILQKHRPFPEAEYNLARAWARLGRAEDARRLFSRLADDGSVPVAIRQRARERLEGR